MRIRNTDNYYSFGTFLFADEPSSPAESDKENKDTDDGGRSEGGQAEANADQEGTRILLRLRLLYLSLSQGVYSVVILYINRISPRPRPPPLWK